MDILSPAQRRLWPQLRPTGSLGMVLYGGTAIALRLGHRPSADFDFFTDKPLDKEALNGAIPSIRQSVVLQDSSSSYTLLVPHEASRDEYVKVSFFGAINVGRVGEPAYTEDHVLQVASLDDLMATKVKAVLQRIEAKDYMDIAALVKAGVSVAKGLAAARLMYGQSFQPSESLKAMVYFEGGDLAILPWDIRETLIEAASGVRDLPPVELLTRTLALPAQPVP